MAKAKKEPDIDEAAGIGEATALATGLEIGKAIYQDSVVSGNVKTFILYQNWSKLREIGSYAAIVFLTLAAVGVGGALGG